MKNDEQLHKWINGELKGEELESFKQRPEYHSLAKLKQATDQLAPPKFDEKQMLSDILSQDKGEAVQRTLGKRPFLSAWVKYAAAAAVLLFGVLFFWPSGNVIHLQTAKGEQKEGQFPNGSTFLLNAESSLSYDADTWETARNVQLDGEAFFDVKKGSPFKVQTRNGSVEVLGTQFNVWSRRRTLEVKCQSGKVGVSSEENPQRTDLLPNDAIRLTVGKIVDQWETTANNIASWNAGVSKLRKVPLAAVLQEIERQFDVAISYGQLDVNEIVSANFSHKDLDAALKTSLGSLPIRYEIKDDNTVVLHKK